MTPKRFSLFVGFLSILLAIIGLIYFYTGSSIQSSFMVRGVILYCCTVFGIILAVISIFKSSHARYGLFALALNISILMYFPYL